MTPRIIRCVSLGELSLSLGTLGSGESRISGVLSLLGGSKCTVSSILGGLGSILSRL